MVFAFSAGEVNSLL